MTTSRRRVLRQPAVAITDPRQARLTERRRLQLDKERTALDRWLKRLQRACRAVAKQQQQRIGRLEWQLRSREDL